MKKKRQKRDMTSIILRYAVRMSAVVIFGTLFLLIGYIVFMGVPHLTPSLFALEYTSDNVSMLPSIINTVIITIISLSLAVPLGIASAIYLVEYAKRGNKVVKWVRLTSETLTGIPSIVYGLFGMLFFVTTLGWGMSLLAGAFTLAIMILPVIMRTTEEALLSVPDSYREGSFGLGAGRLRTVLRIVLPAAVPGILSGIVLSVGRIVGESAALIFTASTATELPKNLMSSGRTMAVHMYAISSEGFNTDKAYATAVVLLVIVVGINAISALLAKRIGCNN